MRKFQIFCLALSAVFVFSAVAAASAFATHEWLLDGAVLGARDLVDSEATELLLEDSKGGPLGIKVAILCSGLNEGWVEPGANGKDEVTEILNLAMTSADITDCTSEENCPTPILVEADNLPWLTELFLNAKGEFRDLVGPGTGGEPGWLASCAGIEDLCEGHTNVLVENNAAEKDVVATFDAESEAEAGTCTKGGAGTGLVKGTILILTEVGTLEVSN